MRARAEGIAAYLLPGLGDILWMAALLSVLAMGSRMMNIDGDLGRHLTLGSYMLDQGRIPVYDLFSHTMQGQPLTPHEWLAQVLFALFNRLLGMNGVILICGLVIATSYWLVYRRARRDSQEVLAAVFAVVLAMAASSLHWLSRPHIFTFLMLALWMTVLESMRRGRLARWWQLPVIMLVWANLHGAFIAGFVTYGLYGIGLAWDIFWRRFPKGEGLHGHFWRFFALGGVTSLLVTWINPKGPGLWGTSFGFVGNRYLVGHTAEYLPPNFHDPSTWPFLLMIGLFVVLLGMQGRRLVAAQVLPAGAWLIMGLYSVRNVPLFTIVAAPLLARLIGDWLETNRHLHKWLERFYYLDQRLLNTELRLHSLVWPVLVVLLVVSGLSGGRLGFQPSENTFDPQVFPVQAVDWLARNPQEGRVFNYFPWGGYLLHRLWPAQLVFIDGQTDFYGETLTRQYEQVLTLSPGWEDVFAQYKVAWAIVPPDEAIARELASRAEWETVYQDETAQVLHRLR